jgi:alkylated DNA repair dioxygenase AlkB
METIKLIETVDFIKPGDLDALIQEIPWEQREIRIFGKTCKVPRLTAWFGAAGYTYSGIENTPNPWTETLERILKGITEATGQTFNSALANLYRDGRDSVSWHSDDEAELGKNPVIASISLGAARTFLMRHKTTGERKRFTLTHGSLLVMAGNCQEEWEHSVPKCSAKGERINLTFRTLK